MSSSTTSNNKSLVLATAAATTFVLVGAPWVYNKLRNQKWRQLRRNNHNHHNNHHSSLSSIVARQYQNNGGGSTNIKPPFPQAVRDLLSKCQLAYLSTVDTELASSHLSLMRFTYLHDEEDGEVVIMSTNQKTKKFDMLQQQKGVALLVHDFGGDDDGDDGGGVGLHSITLNGACRIVTHRTKAELYRAAHLKHNPDYPQFIVGDDIAILCVDVSSARICNINDQVIKWEVTDKP